MIRSVDAAGDHFETKHRRKDGTIYNVEISTNGAVFAGQKLIFCVCRDITERKKVEGALKKSEEKFARLFHSSPDIIALPKIYDGKLIEVNESFIRATGYTREEAIGHTTIELNHWVNPEERVRMVETIAKQGRVTNMESDFRMKSGEIRTWLSSAEKIDIGNEPYLLWIANDISERKLLEEQREKTVMLESILPKPIS